MGPNYIVDTHIQVCMRFDGFDLIPLFEGFDGFDPIALINATVLVCHVTFLWKPHLYLCSTMERNFGTPTNVD